MTLTEEAPPLGIAPKREGTLRAFVISDLHAHSASQEVASSSRPSWLSAAAGPSDERNDALLSLMSMVQGDSELHADLLICCGDIVNRAEPNALEYVWSKLEDLRLALDASRLIITCGNHDVDSRYQYNDYDARGRLQSLTPRFPLSDLRLFDKFWSRHYYIAEDRQVRILVLNSAAYHGHQDEFEHGRVSQATINQLRKEVVGYRTTNILILHHHILQNPQIGLADYSALKNAADLLAFIEDEDLGPWLILHGHKHHPRIAYTSGGSVIFSAGSMGAKLYPELATIERNQVYLVTISTDPRSLGMNVAGTFRAWDYAYGTGWIVASGSSGIPAHGGFGSRMPVNLLASQVASVVSTSEIPIGWEELCLKFPDLSFVAPHDIRKLRQELVRLGRTVHPETKTNHIIQEVF